MPNINKLQAWVKENGAWNNSRTFFKCKNCQLSYQRSPSSKSLFCSRKCHGESMKGKKDDQTANWRGDKVGYGGVHQWVYKKLGKASKCTKCGSTKNIQWANKSKKYLRDLTDWMELCNSCHFAYDKKPLAKIGAKLLKGNTYAKDNPTYYNRWTKNWEDRA